MPHEDFWPPRSKSLRRNIIYKIGYIVRLLGEGNNLIYEVKFEETYVFCPLLHNWRTLHYTHLFLYCRYLISSSPDSELPFLLKINFCFTGFTISTPILFYLGGHRHLKFIFKRSIERRPMSFAYQPFPPK